jgi:gluconokinase
MKVSNLRSCHDAVGGIVYFGRMLDKIRLHTAGKLPAEYQPNLGGGFDSRCVNLLGVKYDDVVARVKEGNSDEEILRWCFEHGRKPTEEQIEIWNDFMRKRGWCDGLSKRLAERKAESGLSDRDDIQTFFDYIDADEGRPVRRPM